MARAQSKSNRPPRARSGVLLALAAVVMFSTSPVFVLLAAPLSPYEITVGRLAVGAGLVIVLGRLNKQPLLPARAHLPIFTLFGLITAVHFLSYIASLNFTTIAQSLAIVYTAPIFVTIFSAWLLKETDQRAQVGGRGDHGRRHRCSRDPVRRQARLVRRHAVWRPARAHIAPSRSACTRLPAGRSVSDTGCLRIRGRCTRWVRYGLCPRRCSTFTPAGYNPKSLLALVAAGLIPLGIGHTLYNASLRRVHATIPNLIATQEVTGGILLGILVLNQIPQPNEIAGVLVSLVGIAIVLM